MAWPPSDNDGKTPSERAVWAFRQRFRSKLLLGWALFSADWVTEVICTGEVGGLSQVLWLDFFTGRGMWMGSEVNSKKRHLFKAFEALSMDVGHYIVD